MMRDNLIKDVLKKLSNNQFSPDAISHRELNTLLNKAKKDIAPIESPDNDEITESKECNNLIADWTKTSQEILLMLNTKERVLTKNKNPKTIMAFGAMGAHINMALQALKATEFDQ